MIIKRRRAVGLLVASAAMSCAAAVPAVAATNGKYLKSSGDLVGTTGASVGPAGGTATPPLFNKFGANPQATVLFGDGSPLVTPSVAAGSTSIGITAHHTYAVGGRYVVSTGLTGSVCTTLLLQRCSAFSDGATQIARIADDVTATGHDHTVPADQGLYLALATVPSHVVASANGATAVLVPKTVEYVTAFGEKNTGYLIHNGSSTDAAGSYRYSALHADDGTITDGYYFGDQLTVTVRYGCDTAEGMVGTGTQLQSCVSLFGDGTAGSGSHPYVSTFVDSISPYVIGLSSTAQPLAATEGSTFSGQVATVHLHNHDLYEAPNSCLHCTYRADIDWNDGTTTTNTGTVEDDLAASGELIITASHQFKEQGVRPYSVRVTAFDPDGNEIASTTADSTVTVADAPLVAATGGTIDLEPGVASSGPIGYFADANPLGSPGDYQITVDWGDGRAGLATASRNGEGGFDVIASHTYAEEGQYTITYHVRSTRGQEATGTTTAYVASPPLG